MRSAYGDHVITVRVCCPTALSAEATDLLRANTAASSLVVHPGASIRPPGDVIEADLPRDAVDDVVRALMDLGVHEEGTIQLLPVETWISRPGLRAEQAAPVADADTVVWPDVIEQAYEDSAYYFSAIAPTRKSWEDRGDRRVLCSIIASDGGRLEGSVAAGGADGGQGGDG